MLINKLLLFDDVIIYEVEISSIIAKAGHVLLLKPKTTGKTLFNNEFPIEGVFGTTFGGKTRRIKNSGL